MAKQCEIADKYIDLLQIKCASRETLIKQLSGGNQQKVILARWLATNPDFLILDEPTRGIDIGTKTEIQKLIIKLASEGKSITALNLAISFAEAGERVLLIDCDLRRPNQARLLDLKPRPGLANVLVRLASAEEAIRPGIRKGLDVLPSGDIPPNPSELLGSNRMWELVEEPPSCGGTCWSRQSACARQTRSFSSAPRPGRNAKGFFPGWW